MSSHKAPMSAAYTAVFLFSIVMIFVVLIAGAIGGSRVSVVGFFYWSYNAWKMYKRDNDTLVSLQQVMLWVQGVGFSIVLLLLVFGESELEFYSSITVVELLVFASLSMSITYFLYKFFRMQKGDSTYPVTHLSNSSIADVFWEQAYRELEEDPHKATWARALTDADGDMAKTRALYVKARATDLHMNQHLNDNAIASEVTGRADDDFEQGQINSTRYAVLKKFMVGLTLILFAVVWAYSYYTSNEFALTPDSDASYLDNPAPRYPQSALRERAQGTTVLRVQVLTTGKLGVIEIIETSGNEALDNAAFNAVKGWSFTPAIKNGVPIDQFVNIPVTFRLK